MILIKALVWFVISTAIELVCAFIVAALLVFFFNLSGIAALAGLGYFQLYWLQMAIYTAVGSAVVMGIGTREYMDS